MAVPKRKTSKARRNTRRTAVSKLSMPAMCKCDNCGAMKAPHKVCRTCGFYKGVQVLTIEED